MWDNIVERILRNTVGCWGLNSIGLGCERVPDCCEHCNELSVSTRGEEFLE
jgi:hypothetical protein